MPHSKEYLDAIAHEAPPTDQTTEHTEESTAVDNKDVQMDIDEKDQLAEDSSPAIPTSGASLKEDLVIGDTARDVPLRASEKKRLHWRDKACKHPVVRQPHN